MGGQSSSQIEQSNEEWCTKSNKKSGSTHHFINEAIVQEIKAVIQKTSTVYVTVETYALCRDVNFMLIFKCFKIGMMWHGS